MRKNQLVFPMSFDLLLSPRARDRRGIEALGRTPVHPNFSVGNEPAVSDLSKGIDVMTAVVWTDIGPRHPIGTRLRSIRARQLDLRGGEMMAYERCLVQLRRILRWLPSTLDPIAARLATFVTKGV